MTKKYLPTRPAKAKCLLVVCLMCTIYLLDKSSVTRIAGYQLYNFVLKPAMWLGLAFLVWSFRRIGPRAKLRHRDFINWWALNFAILFIVIEIAAGLVVDGFGRSPYDHSIKGILINLILIGSALVGTEMARSYVVRNATNEESYLVFASIALFITVTGFAINKYSGLKGYEEGVKFFAQYFAPEFAKNLLATYLAFVGGPLPAIIYMGVLKAFQWFSPILPDLQWLTTAFIGILGPVFSLNILQALYANESKSREDKDEEGPLGWMLTSVVSIFLVWFAVGILPVYPSVIATGSMRPLIQPGDVVMVEKVKKAEGVKKGDIIQFQMGNILVNHRVIELVEGKGATSYRTKGDNNPMPDTALVKREQIRGKVIQVIPKIGWPSLMMKRKNDIL